MPNLSYYDPRVAPVSVHGLYDVAPDHPYRRIPVEVAEATSPGVAYLAHHSAGGRIRFATDATMVSIRAKIKPDGPHADHALLMEAGFDLYLDAENSSRHLGCFKFPLGQIADYEASLPLPAGYKELTINMPLYGEVLSLSIGLDESACVKAHRPYRHELPVVFYGSSITQGACAPRPGQSYQNILCRRFDCEYTNLGFSGNAKAEDAIVNYMAGLPMCAFVSDYDHNAPTVEHLIATHHKMYQAIRASHPDIPYFMLTKPDFYFTPDNIARRDAVMDSYLAARRAGDQNVHFIDGSSFFAFDEREECTVDNCHPNARGFARMAEVIGNVMARVMGW